MICLVVWLLLLTDCKFLAFFFCYFQQVLIPKQFQLDHWKYEYLKYSFTLFYTTHNIFSVHRQRVYNRLLHLHRSTVSSSSYRASQIARSIRNVNKPFCKACVTPYRIDKWQIFCYKNQIRNFTKICPVGTTLCHAVRRMDGHYGTNLSLLPSMHA